jgi:hypothetical protein
MTLSALVLLLLVLVFIFLCRGAPLEAALCEQVKAAASDLVQCVSSVSRGVAPTKRQSTSRGSSTAAQQQSSTAAQQHSNGGRGAQALHPHTPRRPSRPLPHQEALPQRRRRALPAQEARAAERVSWRVLSS